jgi:hypothetical protein
LATDRHSAGRDPQLHVRDLGCGGVIGGRDHFKRDVIYAAGGVIVVTRDVIMDTGNVIMDTGDVIMVTGDVVWAQGT